MNPTALSRFVHIRLVVTVPDDEIEPEANTYNLPPEVLQRAAEIRKRLDAVRLAPLPPDEELPEISGVGTTPRVRIVVAPIEPQTRGRR